MLIYYRQISVKLENLTNVFGNEKKNKGRVGVSILISFNHPPTHLLELPNSCKYIFKPFFFSNKKSYIN